MKKTKTQKGITLIALIITIVVLLILAVVAISSITNDGIITKAQSATSQYEVSQEKEKLQMEVLEWRLTNDNGIPTLETYLSGIYGEENVQLNVDNSITVTVPSGNRYIVTENGEVTLLDGTVEEPEPLVPEIILDKTSITKEIENGSTATETITATLNNATGTLNWTSSNTSVAEISGTENTRTIKLKAAGSATITVSYGSYSTTCIVTVTVIEKSTIEICLIDENDAEEKYKMFTVKEGMTWGEFVNDPEYNTIGLSLWNDAVVYCEPVVNDVGDYATIKPAFVWSHLGTWGQFVFAWEEIIDDGDFEGYAMANPNALTYFSKEEFRESFEAEGGTITYWVKE